MKPLLILSLSLMLIGCERKWSEKPYQYKDSNYGKYDHVYLDYASPEMLKKLSEELDCPIVSAVQTNRSGITMNREISELVDDESSIGISDRITWYASWVGILRRKVSEEILMDTPEMGAHKIITCVARFQGRDAVGHQDQILRTFPDGKKRYINNYINFNIENFKVEERGSLIHSIQRQNSSFKLTSDTNLTDQTL